MDSIMIRKAAIFILLISSMISQFSFAHDDIEDFIEVEIHSLDDLMTLFKKHHYTSQDWQEGNREVPRLTFEGVSENWKKSSSKIPVKQKKQVFFRLMAPLVLMSNENILVERQIVKSAQLSSPKLLAIARKYRVAKGATSSLT